MSEYNVEFYTKSNGEKPAKDFLLSLNPKRKLIQQKSTGPNILAKRKSQNE